MKLPLDFNRPSVAAGWRTCANVAPASGGWAGGGAASRLWGQSRWRTHVCVFELGGAIHPAKRRTQFRAGRQLTADDREFGQTRQTGPDESGG